MTATHRSLIREAREQLGVGVRELARRAGVTAGAVTQWEQSESAGTIREATLERALRSLCTTPEEMRQQTKPNFVGRLERREDRVALELHRAVAMKLVDDPHQVLSKVIRESKRIRPNLQGCAVDDLDEWVDLAMSSRLDLLISVMLGTDHRSVNLRQVSPFGGILSETERMTAIGRATE
jgi:transcriptional regulator with XRE-family HTH domain